jgi:cytochrome c oxidase cbb3-type subunit 3
MSDDQNLPIQDQPFDGIREDDNPLPNWWKSIFYACILFAVGYMVVMHTDFLVHARTPQAVLEAEISAMKARQDSIRALRPPFVYAEMTAQRNDATLLAAGRKMFVANCVACHAAGGAGNIGPNLTDDFWLHGGRIDSVAMTIQNGVPSKGMPTWGNQFDDDQIKTLAIFVKSLRGSHPANPKAPQGVLDTL